MTTITPVDTTYIEAIAIKEGKLQVLPYSYWRQFDTNTHLSFMLKNGFYIIPTTELIDFLQNNIIEPAIEIGAGNGFLGRTLGVPFTDSKMQENPAIDLLYKLLGQPPIRYPDDVETLDAVDAVKKYTPTTVFGSYITFRYNESIGCGNAFGVDDQFIVKNCKRYIMIGNRSVDAHYLNPLMNMPHAEHYFEWLITRSAYQKEGRIFIWDNEIYTAT